MKKSLSPEQKLKLLVESIEKHEDMCAAEVVYVGTDLPAHIAVYADIIQLAFFAQGFRKIALASVGIERLDGFELEMATLLAVFKAVGIKFVDMPSQDKMLASYRKT